ncbi:hypothetical protein BKN38_08320 [Helicobacter sp. CLO-3]|uniref:hypothetical protein n=1 Tax=unclassified Helicobacter TaxID=2593540 RepID=UPI000805D419|nr:MULTISPECIES: hypothetical protein [unclassified Helicobacter]OBV29903.1 hypothetical protein BA723_03510 [Helicobacter sp. CLO-3]OHU81748.1 hypothetical protein BKN38_08320 [Helicobacter sp. CLO-3]
MQKIVSLNYLLQNQKEDEVAGILEGFICSRNLELQKFINFKAIKYEKSCATRTFLVFLNSTFQGFFSIALNVFQTQNLSRNLIKKLSPFHHPSAQFLPCIIIGQLGKSDKSIIKGADLLDYAMSIAIKINQYAGTKFVLIDSVNKEKVIKFYERHNFKALPTETKDKCVRMIRFF